MKRFNRVRDIRASGQDQTMDRQEILTLYDKQQRIEIAYPDARKEVLPEVVRFVRPAPAMSWVAYSRLDEANADVVIREQVDYFSQMNRPFSWDVYDHDAPSNLADRLVAHGFERENPPDDPGPLLVLDVQETSPTLLRPIRADIRRITQRDQLDDVIRVEEQVFGGNFGWIRKRMGDHLEIPDYVSVYVAYVGERPTCTGWIYWHRHSQFASLHGGATLPDYRGQRLYTSVLVIRVQEAIQRGYRYLTIEASPASHPIVAKHGFRLLTHVNAYEWKGSPTA